MEFPPLTFPLFLNQSGYQVKNILCSSGLHVFQFSSDYSPLHEELTKKNKTKQNNNQRKPSVDEPVKILEE